MGSTGQLREEGVSVASAGEFLFEELLRLLGHRFPLIRVTEEVVEGVGGGSDVAGRNGEAVDAILQEVADAAVVAADDRETGGEGFGENDAEGFVPADEGEGIGPGHLLKDLLVREAAEKGDLTGSVVRPDGSLHLASFGAVSGNAEDGLRMLGSNATEGLNEEGHALSFKEAAGAEDHDFVRPIRRTGP